MHVQPSGMLLEEASRLIDEGKLRTRAGAVLPLSQIRKAHEPSKAGYTRGRIVLRVAKWWGRSSTSGSVARASPAARRTEFMLKK